MTHPSQPTRRVSSHDVPITHIMTYGLVVDELLDLAKLVDAFQTLVQRWPVLASILVRDDEGEIAYAPLPPDHNGFSYETLTHSYPLTTDCPIPCSSSRPIIHPSPPSHIFQPHSSLLLTSPQAYIDSAQPIVHIQLTAYTDATAIGFTAPHLFCDAGGVREILKAWGEVVAGLEVGRAIEDTLLLEGIKPVSMPGEGEEESGQGQKEEEELPTGLWYPQLGGQQVIMAPKEEWDWRWVSIPLSLLQRLKKETIDELAQVSDDDWVSEGDVLLAWWILAIFQGNEDESVSSSTPIAITIPVDIRGKLPELVHQVYLHNALHTVTLLFPSISSLSTTPLPSLALDIRRSISTASEDHIRCTLAAKTRSWFATPKHDMVASHVPPGSARVTLSNWLKMGLGSGVPDFSAALVGNGNGKGEEGREGKADVVWVDICNQPEGPTARPVGMAVRRDNEAVWMRFSLPRLRWDTVDKVFREL